MWPVSILGQVAGASVPANGPRKSVLDGADHGRLGFVTVTARVEHVGSLLRPDYLLEARKARENGSIGPAEFKAVEDRAVRAAVDLQEDLDLPVINDGEMRRDSFQAELTAACDGFAGVSLDAWLWGDWHSSEVGDASIKRPQDLAVVAPLRKRRNLAAEEFTLRARVRRPGRRQADQGDAAEPDAVRQPLVA